MLWIMSQVQDILVLLVLVLRLVSYLAHCLPQESLGWDHVSDVKDYVNECLEEIEAGKTVGQEDIDALKRRKLIIPWIWKGYSVRKGPKYAPKRKKAATDLTRQNLQRGDWKELEFKEYNFKAKGQPLDCGHLHPLLLFAAFLLELAAQSSKGIDRDDSHLSEELSPIKKYGL